MDNELVQLIDCDPDVRPILPVLLPKLEELLKTSVDQNYQGERVLQLFRLQRADYFYRGIQNIAPTMDPTTGAIAWEAFGVSTGQNRDPEAAARAFDYNPRLTKSYGDKYVAVLGQRPFYDCTAEPGDPKSDIDRRGARQVNLLIQMLHGQIDVRVLNLRLFYYLFKTGTVFGYVRPVTDGKKYGFLEVPNLVPHQQCYGCGTTSPGLPPGQCPQCGVPFGPPNTATVPAPDPQNPTLRFPKTSVVIDFLNGYTLTYPFSVAERTESPWYVNKCEKDKGEVLLAFPQTRKIVGNGGGSFGGGTADATGAVVRAGAQSQTGTIRSRNLNQWTLAYVWLHPSRLELIEDDQIRAAAKAAFPDGLKIVQVEDKTVAVRKEDYRDRLSSCQPTMADYLFTDGGCWGMLGLEDAWSNLLNIIMENLETGIIKYITNPDYVDADALNRNRYSPNRFIEAIPRAGESLENAVKILPGSDYPQQIPQTFQIIDQAIQNILGLLPQVYGQMPGNLTLGQARMMLNQGLMQLGTVAELATNFWEQSWTNMVKLYVQVAATNPEFQGESIDLDLIRNSNWTIRGDTAIPRSFAERVESLRELLQQAPQLADKLKIGDPVNSARLRDYLDLPDFDDPDADAMEALKEVIDQLFQAAPTQPPGEPDPMTGMPGPPGPPQPSIPFDGVLFDPQMAVSLCRQALLSAMLKPTGPRSPDSPGFANVRAFMAAAQQAIPQPPMFPPPKLSFSAKLTDLTPEQEGATLNDFGINVPPPSGVPGPQQQPQQNGSPAGGGPQSPPPGQQNGPPPLPPPDQLMQQQGGAGMMIPPTGAIQ